MYKPDRCHTDTNTNTNTAAQKLRLEFFRYISLLVVREGLFTYEV